jgi:hypothetical protein
MSAHFTVPRTAVEGSKGFGQRRKGPKGVAVGVKVFGMVGVKVIVGVEVSI